MGFQSGEIKSGGARVAQGVRSRPSTVTGVSGENQNKQQGGMGRPQTSVGCVGFLCVCVCV